MSMRDIMMGVAHVSTCSVLLPIICYLYVKNGGRIGKPVFLLLCIALLADVGGLLSYNLGLKGFLIPNVFFAIQFILLCLIYYSLFINKKLVGTILFSFPIAFIVYSLFLQSIHEYQSLFITLESILLIVFAIRYCFQTFQILPTREIMKYFPMWVNMAVLFYFAFNLFLLASANYIFKNAPTEVAMVFWGFHNLNNIIKNGMFATGIYVGLVKQDDELDD
jgi:hypothetical protein